MSCLLDSSVLVALSQPGHVHRTPAKRWLGVVEGGFATCPITQGALLRLLLRAGTSAEEARRSLESVVADVRHEFWPDDLDYLSVRLTGVVGHRQLTDAYLAALARARSASLATFDRGLAALHPDVAELIAT